MKELIGKKIADAREQRELKQSDLADFLGLKSPQAVSEIERGKVNISAADLYKLANYLNKPITYFYGDDFGGKEVEDVLAMVKELPLDELNSIIQIAKGNTKMKGLLGSLPQEGKLDPVEHREVIEKFYNEMLDIRRPIESQLKAMDLIISQFEELLRV
jgi:transcriptional regulator with XRE-family HTH domain